MTIWAPATGWRANASWSASCRPVHLDDRQGNVHDPPRPLTALHRLLRPRTYLEIGVCDGRSLALASAPSIRVDPAHRIRVRLHPDARLVKSTSDLFFARRDPLAPLRPGPRRRGLGRRLARLIVRLRRDPSPTLDLAFIDGMHWFEFALRDFMNVHATLLPQGIAAGRHLPDGRWELNARMFVGGLDRRSRVRPAGILALPPDIRGAGPVVTWLGLTEDGVITVETGRGGGAVARAAAGSAPGLGPTDGRRLELFLPARVARDVDRIAAPGAAHTARLVLRVGGDPAAQVDLAVASVTASGHIRPDEAPLVSSIDLAAYRVRREALRAWTRTGSVVRRSVRRLRGHLRGA